MKNLSPEQNDQILATDLLLASKSAVRNYAYALTESSSDEVKDVLKRHLDDAIEFHEGVSSYMMNKGYYIPEDINRQIRMDIDNARAVTGMRVGV